ncbi:MAG: homocysteine S-methyltransferase family protein [Alphaproteobacteria bacterium]
MSTDWIDRRVAAGGIVLIDGAMGTELQRRGVHMDQHAWSGIAVLEHGAIVRQIHEDYIRAGADVIITNTFASSRRALEPAGHGADVAGINRQAVDLARQARERAADRPVAIAGSISTYFGRLDPPKAPDPAQERAAYREQAELLAGAGCDLIALEMMSDVEQTEFALDAALAVGLPVWLGLSVRRPEADGAVMLFDESHTLAEAVTAFAGRPIAAVTVMHSRVPVTAPALAIVRRHWSGLVGVYPHAGRFKMPEWQFIDGMSPDDYAREAAGWVAQGAALVGGCCGIGPAHIQRLAAVLRPNAG